MRRFAAKLKQLGFARTRASFLVRPRTWVIDFVHVHKYSFGTGYRVHLGMRVRNERFHAAHLNGPAAESFSSSAECSQPVRFRFAQDPDSLERCAAAMAAFVEAEGLAWFEAFGSSAALLSSDSPLTADAKADLRRALDDPSAARDSVTTVQVLGPWPLPPRATEPGLA